MRLPSVAEMARAAMASMQGDAQSRLEEFRLMHSDPFKLIASDSLWGSVATLTSQGLEPPNLPALDIPTPEEWERGWEEAEQRRMFERASADAQLHGEQRQKIKRHYEDIHVIADNVRAKEAKAATKAATKAQQGEPKKGRLRGNADLRNRVAEYNHIERLRVLAEHQGRIFNPTDYKSVEHAEALSLHGIVDLETEVDELARVITDLYKGRYDWSASRGVADGDKACWIKDRLLEFDNLVKEGKVSAPAPITLIKWANGQ